MGGWVMLRDLSGADEEAVGGTDTAAAIGLLDRLLVRTDGAAAGPGEASSLTASDRDRLLADTYATEFGPRIDCVLCCEVCDSRFDIDFHLPDLLASVHLASTNAALARESILTLKDGRRVRVPRGSDEMAVQAMSAESAEVALLARCMIEGEAAAPLLDRFNAGALLVRRDGDIRVTPSWQARRAA